VRPERLHQSCQVSRIAAIVYILSGAWGAMGGGGNAANQDEIHVGQRQAAEEFTEPRHSHCPYPRATPRGTFRILPVGESPASINVTSTSRLYNSMISSIEFMHGPTPSYAAPDRFSSGQTICHNADCFGSLPRRVTTG
jgi:hypothetical protein